MKNSMPNNNRSIKNRGASAHQHPVRKCPKYDTYLRDVTRRWKQEIGNADKTAILLFPYITSTTAERVLGQIADPKCCEIYTDFSALHFASGSSSLKTLKGLLDKGFPLFHLPGLHAKILLSKGRFVSIGSQNLTAKGRVNLEATSCHEDEDIVAYVEQYVGEWTKRRIPITQEMIADMLALLPPLKKEVHRLLKEVDSINNDVDEKEKQRVAEREKEKQRQLEELEEHRRRASLRDSIRRRADGWCGKVCQVKLLPQEQDDGTRSSTYSLMPKHGDDLTSWSTDDFSDFRHLAGYNRYLCLNESTCRIGWARVTRTRISFVHNGLRRMELKNMGPWRCHFDFAATETTRNFDTNVTITVKEDLGPKYSESERFPEWLMDGLDAGVLTTNDSSIRKRQKVQLSGWFGLDYLALDLDYEPTNEMGEWIWKHQEEATKVILPLLLSPFRYQKALALCVNIVETAPCQKLV